MVDLVVCGYTDPKKSRAYLGSLVTGVYDRGKLVYSGRVGGGFSRDGLQEAFEKIEPLQAEASPLCRRVATSCVSEMENG